MPDWKPDTAATQRGEHDAKKSESLTFSQTPEQHEAKGVERAATIYKTPAKQEEYKQGWMKPWQLNQHFMQQDNQLVEQ